MELVTAITKKKILTAALILFTCALLCSAVYIGYQIIVYVNKQNTGAEAVQLFETARQQNSGTSQTEAQTNLPTVGYVPDDSDTVRPARDTSQGQDNKTQESDWAKQRYLLLEEEERGREIYKDLLDINPDFFGTIEIPGVFKPQPYVISRDNEEYLSIDFYGRESITGTIFLNMYNDRLMTDNNTVFFGHYTDTGLMFGNLWRYNRSVTFKESPVIILSNLIGESIWIIFAAHIISPDAWWITPYNDPDGYAAYLEEIQALNFFVTDIDVSIDDKIITLLVCDYTYDDTRFLVHARRLRDGEEVPESTTAVANTNRKRLEMP